MIFSGAVSDFCCSLESGKIQWFYSIGTHLSHLASFQRLPVLRSYPGEYNSWLGIGILKKNNSPDDFIV